MKYVVEDFIDRLVRIIPSLSPYLTKCRIDVSKLSTDRIIVISNSQIDVIFNIDDAINAIDMGLNRAQISYMRAIFEG
jgi:hypothetical protein